MAAKGEKTGDEVGKCSEDAFDKKYKVNLTSSYEIRCSTILF